MFPILSWRRIVIDDVETPYIISDKGIIMNDTNGEFMLVTPDKDNYPVVKLFINGEDKIYKVHRLVCEMFNGNPFNLPEVDHKNRNHWDSSKENLEFVTGAENIRRLQKSREIEKNELTNHDKISENRTSYTELQIIQVCMRLVTSESVTKISRKTSVDVRTIYLIKAGKIWKNISCYFSFNNDGLFGAKELVHIKNMIEENHTNHEILESLNIDYHEYFNDTLNMIRKAVNNN